MKAPKWLKRWLEVPEFHRPIPPVTAQPRKSAVNDQAIKIAGLPLLPPERPVPFKPPELPKGVLPADVKTIAMDSGGHPYMALDDASLAPFYQYANLFNAGLGFQGYPYLAEKTRISEYRSPSVTLATEMTRKWIKFKTIGKGDRSKEIEKIEKAFKDFKLRTAFRRAAMQDGFFGRSQIYPRIRNQTGDDLRKMPFVPESVGKGDLLGFQVIEPYWTTPYWYNTTDPTDPNFFKPLSWFIMGKQTHASRLMIMVSNELPDLFKPAYNFSGMSMTQLMEPYVNQWLRTRNSVSDLVYNFSTTALATDMQDTLAGVDNGDPVFRRAKLFTETRSNKGMMLINKDTEELTQLNTPLSGLDALQAQSQEHMAAPCHIPLVKLFGITPSGLNASSEEEIQVWYDWVKASQENLYTDPIDQSLELVQRHLFGKVYEEIGWEFVDLTELDGEALARNRKSDGDAAVAYIQTGVISPEEERERLASDPNSGYNNLVVSDVPDPPPQMQPNDLEDADEPAEA
jgi:uncharacterized protein